MSACASRSLFTVNDETPASYFPEPTPAMIESNPAVWNSALRPSFCATRLNRSTSKPWMVDPSAATNSLGAYVVSLPTTILPSALMLAGTFAARAGSAATDDGAPEEPPAALLPEELPPDEEPLPHPVT